MSAFALSPADVARLRFVINRDEEDGWYTHTQARLATRLLIDAGRKMGEATIQISLSTIQKFFRVCRDTAVKTLKKMVFRKILRKERTRVRLWLGPMFGEKVVQGTNRYTFFLPRPESVRSTTSQASLYNPSSPKSKNRANFVPCKKHANAQDSRATRSGRTRAEVLRANNTDGKAAKVARWEAEARAEVKEHTANPNLVAALAASLSAAGTFEAQQPRMSAKSQIAYLLSGREEANGPPSPNRLAYLDEQNEWVEERSAERAHDKEAARSEWNRRMRDLDDV